MYLFIVFLCTRAVGSGVGAGGVIAPQILEDHLTLFQPGGGRLCPPQYYSPHLIFKSSYGPAYVCGLAFYQ